MKAVIRFYEGSYQYNSAEMDVVSNFRSLAEFASGVLLELNYQYNYRKTDKDLWAECICTVDGKVSEHYRVTRIDNNRLRLVDVLENMEEIKVPVVPTNGLTFKA